jgi:hypothetical protein
MLKWWRARMSAKGPRGNSFVRGNENANEFGSGRRE